MLGLIEDIERRLTPVLHEGDVVVLLGQPLAQEPAALAGSEYLARVHDRAAGRPAIDLGREVAVQRLVLDANKRGLLTAAHDCSDGGLAVALAEMCMAGDVGIDASATELGDRLDATLFGEPQSRFVVGARDAEAVEALAALAAASEVPATVLGPAIGQRIRLGPVDVPLDDLRAAYEGGLERILTSH